MTRIVAKALAPVAMAPRNGMTLAQLLLDETTDKDGGNTRK